MAIKFESPEGIGTLDVTQMISEMTQGVVTGVSNGLVRYKSPDGSMGSFSLASWAQSHQANIVFMDGFNSPDTALDQPPNGMNYMDQSVFYHNGQDMDALEQMFPRSTTNSEGATVVLDNDGLWKTMWSPKVQAPMPPPSFQEQVEMNEVNDPRLTMRTAGVTFLFGIAGEEVTHDRKLGGVTIPSIVEVLKIVARNAPYENKFQIGKLLEQTTGITQFKFFNALLAPEDVGVWLKRATMLNSFQFRSSQMELAKLMVDGLRALAHAEFESQMKNVYNLEETNGIRINLKVMFSEFVQFLVSMDLLRDISRSTGLSEWIALNEDNSLDASKLPQMPEFVEKFVTLLRWSMPIVKEASLQFVTGKKGFKSIMALMTMIDDCVYSLAGIPDSSAKYKMFMALKKLQSSLETKLAFHYHPDPMKNKDGLKENPFMQAKQIYSVKREHIYNLCQTPRESWNNTLLDTLREQENLEQFYDAMPAKFAKVFKSFAAMDAAYDMQPWVDVMHADRTHDPFSEFNESFGLRPPEAGYLAKNSPRAVVNISETLMETAGYLVTMPQENNRELLRNPWLMANLLKTMMTASVNREIGTVEVLSKFGVGGDTDPEASPDMNRIWEDPQQVQMEHQRQIEEMMGQMAIEQSMQQEQQGAQAGQEQQMAEQAREQGGAGPSGPPQRAMPGRAA